MQFRNMARNSSNAALDNETLSRVAPSVFATAASDKMSDRYSFIPTIQVVDVLRSQGWEPTAAMQSRARSGSGAIEAKHIVRFRNTNEKQVPRTELRQVGDVSHTELVLVNSHDGSSAFQLMGGVFRLVCSNGAIVGDEYARHTIRHTGFTTDKVIEAQYKVLESVPKISASIQLMGQVQLEQSEQLALAEAALSIRYGQETDENGVLLPVKSPITAEQLLLVRRSDDRSNDLWTTFNRIQENVMRGGLRGISESQDERTGRITRRRTRTREVASVSENVRLNRALWTLAERMAELKA